MTTDRAQRVAIALAPELDAMMAQLEARTFGHDEIVFDKMAGSVLYLKNGEPLWRARAELIGRYSVDLGLFRWWWVGKATVGETRMDKAYAEAQRLDLKSLLDKQAVAEDLEEGRRFARLAAHLAGADGVLEREEPREGDDLRLAFYALFDSWHGGAKTRSLTPFAVSRTMPPPAVMPTPGSAFVVPRAPTAPSGLHGVVHPPTPAAGRPPSAPAAHEVAHRAPSAPAAHEVTHHQAPHAEPHAPNVKSAPPRGSGAPGRPVRDPNRELVDALIPSITHALAAHGHQGFRQALLVVSIDMQGEKARFFTQLVVQTERGELEPVDASRSMVDAVVHLIADDARSGNGRWRRLSVRFAREQGRPTVEHVHAV